MFPIKIKTLKNKLILYFIILTIVPSLVLSLYYYYYSKNRIEENIVNNAINETDYIMNNIDKQLSLAKQLSNWFYMNNLLDIILTKKYSDPNNTYNKDIRMFVDFLNNQILISPTGKHVLSLIISGENKMIIKAGLEGSMIDEKKIQSYNWFQEGLVREFKWLGLRQNPASIYDQKYLLPIVRPVLHTASSKQIGWLFIGFNVNLVEEIFKNYKTDLNNEFFLVDASGMVIPYPKKEYINQSLNLRNWLKKISDEDQGNFVITTDSGEKKLIIFQQSRLSKWNLVKVLSFAPINKQKQILFRITTLIFIGSLLFTTIFTVYLSNNLTQPLTGLLSHMNNIAQGNFSRNISIEGEDEIGRLGKRINEVAKEIKDLLATLLKEEKEKQYLELKVLQHQVNPHFLYNTLNSIKWMATVQKAEGIKNMVSALSKLLYNLSKDNMEKIAIKKEISLLKEYVYIEQIRYKGRIKLNISAEEELLNYKILRFTLQPIVENAIFHGIEQKKGAGKIDIVISRKDEDLVIVIKDDGVGMTDSQIKKAFSSNYKKKHKGLSGIGLKNVQKRIKLNYGDKYGISIESKKDLYTKVIIKLPLEKAKGDLK